MPEKLGLSLGIDFFFTILYKKFKRFIAVYWYTVIFINIFWDAKKTYWIDTDA